MYSHSRAAFTLWEILGVLCIIAIVTAILYPVYQRPRYNNHRSSCQSDLKQLGLAFIQYTQDYDEQFPRGVTALNNGWAGEIFPYVKSTGIYHCPDDPTAGDHISYAENQRIAGLNLDKFSDAQYTVALYESTTLNCDPSTPETVSMTGLTAPQDSTRHDSIATTFALNFLAVDGHVRMIKPGQISSGLNAVSPKQAMIRGDMMTFAIK